MSPMSASNQPPTNRKRPGHGRIGAAPLAGNRSKASRLDIAALTANTLSQRLSALTAPITVRHDHAAQDQHSLVRQPQVELVVLARLERAQILCR
jgi:hypothetical protein